MADQALTITIDRFPSQSRYDVDDAVLLRATVRDALTGALVDPDTMAFRTRSPSGVEASYSYLVDAQVTRTSAGVYEFTALIDAPNDWIVGAIARIGGTGRGVTNRALAVRAPAIFIEPVDPGVPDNAMTFNDGTTVMTFNDDSTIVIF